jgi:hypothetical protein
METWVKPNGTEVVVNTNHDNLEAARKLGWKPKEAEKPKAKPVLKKKF